MVWSALYIYVTIKRINLAMEKAFKFVACILSEVRCKLQTRTFSITT